MGGLVGFAALGQGVEAHGGEVVVQHLGGIHPHGLHGALGRQGADAAIAHAVVEGNAALHGMDHFAQGDVRRGAGQAHTAAGAPGRHEDPGLHQIPHDAPHKVQRQQPVLGDVGDGYLGAGRQAGQVQHHAGRVIGLSGDAEHGPPPGEAQI